MGLATHRGMNACAHSTASSKPFQNSITWSSSVHRRTTTHTGRRAKGCMCAARSPSLGKPSVTIVTTTCWPVARSCGSIEAIAAATSCTCWQSGVAPEGPALNDAWTCWTSPAPSTTTFCLPVRGALRNRNSVGARRAAASPAWNSTMSTTSCQRLQLTRDSLPEDATTRRCPSGICMLPELSTIQKRRANVVRVASSACVSPGGKPCSWQKLTATESSGAMPAAYAGGAPG
mmetsp:Transcript_22478/g.60801  ORF Transcript_22478/g.60801 Transcript_22478/m.60801 type:complete len:232 (-) Transcript_22478:101-796(-)